MQGIGFTFDSERDNQGRTPSYPCVRICRQLKRFQRIAAPGLNIFGSNGQIERMDRARKDADARRFYRASPDKLHSHLNRFVTA